jgi:phosphatidylinositol alpha-1,6-mannosyltransferase
MSGSHTTGRLPGLRPIIIMRSVFRRARAVVVVSQPIKDALEERLGFTHERTTVAWNGISLPSDASTYAGSGERGRIFCLCRLVERKNLPNAVRAVGRLIDEGYDIQFRIAGSGQEAEVIDAAIAEVDAGPRVQRLGPVDDEQAVAEYKASSIFLHPQVSVRGGADLEGFGISIADALSFGCAVVAGASGGPRDYIQDGLTGFLVEGSSLLSIVDRLRSLVSDPEYCKRVGAAGRSFALSELTWERHVQKILDVTRS